jgi:CheY-like chemotaxis protein
VFSTHYQSIDKLVSHSLKVSFITNSQSSNLPNQLSSIWAVECLSHPFTPQQVSSFLQQLFISKAEDSSQHVILKHEHQMTHYEGHILLVEDNNINQVVAGEMLKLLGLTFDVAEDGQQAITKIVNSPQYDLVLMDIQMPIMDGYKATRTIRQQGHNTLIICGLSANAMKQDYKKAEEAGMDDYIVKPVKHKTLEDLIAKYLPKKNEQQQKHL